MALPTRRVPGGAGSGFTLIEILMVVLILGVLAALVIPQFTNAGNDARDASIRTELMIVRQQIEYYRLQNRKDPRLIANQWDDLLIGDYLHYMPANPLNDSSLIATQAGAGVGWVWRNSGNGIKQLFATDETFLAEYPG